MTRINVHIPTETELARTRLGGQFARLTLGEVAANLARNLTRECYLDVGGANECVQRAEWGIIEIIVPPKGA